MFQHLRKKIVSFSNDRSGATAIEYGLITALIFLAILTTMQGISTRTNVMYEKINTAVEKATT